MRGGRRRRRSRGYLVSFVIGAIFGGAVGITALVQSDRSVWPGVGFAAALGLAFMGAQWLRNAMLGN